MKTRTPLALRLMILILFLLHLSAGAKPQHQQPAAEDTSRKKHPEVLTSGFFDVINNGQINASARFLKLHVGEPGKFYLPLSFYSGVSSYSFENINRKNNDQLVNNLINPVTGLANISFDQLQFFKNSAGLTRTGYLYQFGERLLSGYKMGAATDPSTGRIVNFLNTYAVGGLYFQTGAWEKNDLKNIGLFWMTARYIACYSGPDLLAPFLPDTTVNGFYHGYSVGWGIDINKLVNLKLVYYRYMIAPEMYHGLPIYQFTFHYYMKSKD